MLIPVDPQAIPQKIDGFIDDAVFPITRIVRDDVGDAWAVLGKRLSLSEYRALRVLELA
jgi:hypothetical protein